MDGAVGGRTCAAIARDTLRDDGAFGGRRIITPGRPTSDPAQFIQGSPVLHVRDVPALARYFRDVLGFRWDFGDERYAVVWRDNSAVHFTKDTSGPSGVHLFQWVRDVDAYHAEVLARRAQVTSGPANTAYGLREFTVSAPDGLIIVFGQDIDWTEAPQGGPADSAE